MRTEARTTKVPGSMRLFKGRTDAHGYFRDLCWQGGVFCPRCQSRRVYVLKEGRMRCGGCGYTFHDFSGRWINRVKIPAA